MKLPIIHSPYSDNVITAPPITRVSIHASKEWYEEVGDNKEMFATAILDRHGGDILQFFQTMLQAYSAGIVANLTNDRSYPDLHIRCEFRQGLAYVALDVYPENVQAKPGEIPLGDMFIVEGPFKDYPIFGQGARANGTVVSWCGMPIGQQTPWDTKYAPSNDESNNITYVVTNGGYAFDPLFKNETPDARAHNMLVGSPLWGAVRNKGYSYFTALGSDGLPDFNQSPGSGGVPENWALDHVGASGICPQPVQGLCYFEVEIMALPGAGGPGSQTATLAGNKDAGTYIKTEEIEITTATLTLKFTDQKYYQSPAIGLAPVGYVPKDPDTGKPVAKPTQVWGSVLGLDPDPSSTDGRSIYTLPTEIKYNNGLDLKMFFTGSYWWQNPHYWTDVTSAITTVETTTTWWLSSAPGWFNDPPFSSPIIWSSDTVTYTGGTPWSEDGQVGTDEYLLITTLPMLADKNPAITNPNWLLARMPDHSKFYIGVDGQCVIGSIWNPFTDYPISGPDAGAVMDGYLSAKSIDEGWHTYKKTFSGDGDGGMTSYDEISNSPALQIETIYEGSNLWGGPDGFQLGNHITWTRTRTYTKPSQSVSKSYLPVILSWPSPIGYILGQVGEIGHGTYFYWELIGEVGGITGALGEYHISSNTMLYQVPGFQTASTQGPSTLLGDVYVYPEFNTYAYSNNVGISAPAPGNPAKVTYGPATKTLDGNSGGANRLGTHTWIYKGRADLLGNGDTPKQGDPDLTTPEGVWTGVDLGNFKADDVIQVAVDTKTRKVWYGKNNKWYDKNGPYELKGDDTLDKHDCVTYLDGDKDTKYYPACAFRWGHTKLRMRFGQSTKYLPPPNFKAYSLNAPISTG